MENFEIIYTDNFIKVSCKEGHYLTNWDKQNILQYTDSKVMYCPLNYDLSEFYCVTEAEHNNYMEQQMQRAKELEAERNNEVNQ